MKLHRDIVLAAAFVLLTGCGSDTPSAPPEKPAEPAEATPPPPAPVKPAAAAQPAPEAKPKIAGPSWLQTPNAPEANAPAASFPAATAPAASKPAPAVARPAPKPAELEAPEPTAEGANEIGFASNVVGGKTIGTWMEQLKSGDKDYVMEAIYALELAKDRAKAAVPKLKELAQSPTKEIADEAQVALKAIGN